MKNSQWTPRMELEFCLRLGRVTERFTLLLEEWGRWARDRQGKPTACGKGVGVEAYDMDDLTAALIDRAYSAVIRPDGRASPRSRELERVLASRYGVPRTGSRVPVLRSRGSRGAGRGIERRTGRYAVYAGTYASSRPDLNAGERSLYERRLTVLGTERWFEELRRISGGNDVSDV